MIFKIYIGVIIAFIITTIINSIMDAWVIKTRNEYTEKIMEMNKMLLEQNKAIREQNVEIAKHNQNLNKVIVSVCSKSVRYRRKQNEETEKGTSPAEAETSSEGSCSGEGDRTSEEARMDS